MQNKYILNNTPIRTCVKYKINDIIIENLYLPSKTNEFKYVEDMMKDKLDTKVKISDKKIEISFVNVADLNRILEIIDIKEW